MDSHLNTIKSITDSGLEVTIAHPDRMENVMNGIISEIHKVLVTHHRVWARMGKSEEEINQGFAAMLETWKETSEASCTRVEEEFKALQDRVLLVEKVIEENETKLARAGQAIPKNADKLTGRETLIVKVQKLEARAQVVREALARFLHHVDEVRSQESLLCEELDMPALLNFDHDSPTSDQFNELKSHIKLLKDEKLRRERKMDLIHESILSLWDCLGKDPQNERERQVYRKDMCLTSEMIAFAESLKRTLEDELEATMELCNGLLQEIAILWDRLKEPEEYKETFKAAVAGKYTEADVGKLRAELDRLQSLKRTRLDEFVKAVEDEIKLIMDKLCYGKNQIADIEADEGFMRSSSKDTYLAHLERTAERLNAELTTKATLLDQYRELNRRIEELRDAKKASRRQSYLLNRGGKILKVTQQERASKKAIPKLYRDMKIGIIAWEREEERTFFAFDKKLLDLLEEKMTNAESVDPMIRTYNGVAYGLSSSRVASNVSSSRPAYRVISSGIRKAGASGIRKSGIKKAGGSGIKKAGVSGIKKAGGSGVNKPGESGVMRAGPSRAARDNETSNASTSSRGSLPSKIPVLAKGVPRESYKENRLPRVVPMPTMMEQDDNHESLMEPETYQSFRERPNAQHLFESTGVDDPMD